MPVFSGQNREQLRQMYLDAWRKYTARQPLSRWKPNLPPSSPSTPNTSPCSNPAPRRSTADYTPEGGRENPFLHMGLHLAIREQVATDRPPGIAQIHQSLSSASATPTPPSTPCWSCLAETLWESQRSGSAPDEQRYLERLRAL